MRKNQLAHSYLDSGLYFFIITRPSINRPQYRALQKDCIQNHWRGKASVVYEQSGVRFGIMGLEFTANLGDFTGECRRIPKT
jgi:hypothetical protein